MISLIYYGLVKKKNTSFRMWILVWVVFWNRKREPHTNESPSRPSGRLCLACLWGIHALPHGHPHPPLRAPWPQCDPAADGQEALADVTVQPLRGLAVTLSEKCVVFYFRPPRGRPHFECLPFRLPHIGFSCQKNFSNAWKSRFHLQHTKLLLSERL